MVTKIDLPKHTSLINLKLHYVTSFLKCQHAYETHWHSVEQRYDFVILKRNTRKRMWIERLSTIKIYYSYILYKHVIISQMGTNGEGNEYEVVRTIIIFKVKQNPLNKEEKAKSNQFYSPKSTQKIRRPTYHKFTPSHMDSVDECFYRERHLMINRFMLFERESHGRNEAKHVSLTRKIQRYYEGFLN